MLWLLHFYRTLKFLYNFKACFDHHVNEKVKGVFGSTKRPHFLQLLEKKTTKMWLWVNKNIFPLKIQMFTYNVLNTPYKIISYSLFDIWAYIIKMTDKCNTDRSSFHVTVPEYRKYGATSPRFLSKKITLGPLLLLMAWLCLFVV